MKRCGSGRDILSRHVVDTSIPSRAQSLDRDDVTDRRLQITVRHRQVVDRGMMWHLNDVEWHSVGIDGCIKRRDDDGAAWFICEHPNRDAFVKEHCCQHCHPNRSVRFSGGGYGTRNKATRQKAYMRIRMSGD